MASEADSESAGDAEIDEKEENSVCNTCKKKLMEPTKCVLCENVFHKSCITRLKSTILITSDEVMCCLQKGNEREKLIACITGLARELKHNMKEIMLLDRLLKETEEKNNFLEQEKRKYNLQSKTQFSEVVKMRMDNDF